MQITSSYQRYGYTVARWLIAFLMTGALFIGSVRAQPLSAVATFSIIGDWVQEVAGELVDLTVLVGPDSDSHVYEPVPSDVISLGNADLVFENGLDFETWLDRLYTSSESTATRVILTEGVDLIRSTDHDHDEADHVEHDHDHGHHHHGDFDPHTWLDVANAIIAVELIRDALVEADPENTDAYRANAEAYLAELEDLNMYIKTRTTALPPERRVLVTNHDAFAYFARAYGFTVIGSLMPTSTDSGDVSAAELAALVDSIQAADAQVVFIENVTNDALAKRIAAETGTKIGPNLYSDALGVAGSAGDTYLKMMRSNVDAIVQALE